MHFFFWEISIWILLRLLGESSLPVLHMSKVLIKLTHSVRLFCQWYFSQTATTCCGLPGTAEAGADCCSTTVLATGKGYAVRKENASLLLLKARVRILVQEWFPLIRSVLEHLAEALLVILSAGLSACTLFLSFVCNDAPICVMLLI